MTDRGDVDNLDNVDHVDNVDNADHAGPEPSPDAPPPVASPPEPTLGTLVTSIARRTPDALLATCVIVGLVGGGVIALAAPTWWRLIPPLVLLSTFGAWGIADRERDATGSRRVTFAIVRAIAVIASLVAAGVMILAFMGVAIGRWIS